jgi:hypothetical protein
MSPHAERPATKTAITAHAPIRFNDFMISLLILERAECDPSAALQPLRIMVSPGAVSICVSLSAKRLFGNEMFHCGPILAALRRRKCKRDKKARAFNRTAGFVSRCVTQRLRTRMR